MNNITFVGKTVNSEEAKEHVHGDFDIIFFKSSGTVKESGKSISVEEGDVAIIPPLTMHSVNAGNAVRAVLSKALLPVKSTLIIPSESADEIRRAIESALNHFLKNKTENNGVLSAYGNLIAALTAAYAAPNGYSPAVAMIMEDIDRHIGDTTYSLENFIRTLPLNYDYVRKLFKKETGVTPHAYLMRARMERAKTIILSGVTNRYSNYSVTQIAEACGYSEPLYFSRVFKNYYGAAPSDFIKNNLN